MPVVVQFPRSRSKFMQKRLLSIGLSCVLSTLAMAQTAPKTPTKTTPKTAGTKPASGTTKAATAAKPATAPGAGPSAIIETTAGKMTCKLFPDKAPIGVANFIGLATGTKDWKNPVSHAKKHGVPLYDGTIFHRVIPDFMIQGGDPAGTGEGDPGYTFGDEIAPGVNFDRPGRLAMANSGPNTNGSQFFITEVPTPHLNGHHTIFGQCDEPSIALVKKIARVPRDANDRPSKP